MDLDTWKEREQVPVCVVLRMEAEKKETNLKSEWKYYWFGAKRQSDILFCINAIVGLRLREGRRRWTHRTLNRWNDDDERWWKIEIAIL